jgi:Luciferase-like monooxygenase
MQIGIDSFVETGLDPSHHGAPNGAERVRDLVEGIELADQVGLDVFGIGEHHRQSLSHPPAVILAAAAARTKKIRLALLEMQEAGSNPGTCRDDLPAPCREQDREGRPKRLSCR